MSDSMRRLLDDRDDARLTSVLRAGLDDGPSDESMKRAAAALGIGSAVALTAAASASSAAAKTGTNGLIAIFTAIAKWFAVGALMGGVTSAPFVLRSQPAKEQLRASVTSTMPAPKIVVANQKPAPPREPVAPASPDPVPATEPTPAPPRAAFANAVADAPHPIAPRPSVAALAAPPASTLAAEVSQLDEARRSLKAGNPSAALVALDRYQAAPGPHALAAEATLLRVQALVAAGRKADAERIARSALESRGPDGYACRLAKLAGIANPGCPISE